MVDKVKAVLIGCGGISQNWLDAVKDMPGLEIAGLVDLDEAAARRRVAQFDLTHAQVGVDLPEMLAAVKPEIVFDCTVPAAHTAVTLTALHYGCHVLGEKPMADSMDNARRMVDAALKAGKLYAVIQNRRYDPDIRRLKQFITSGALGPLTTVNSDFYIGAHFGGFRDQMTHVLLLDMAIHTFDETRFLCGADPLSVYCHETNPGGSWYAHGAAVTAVFTMTGGVVYSYRGSWCAEGLMTSWNSEWRLVGQKGSIKWNGEKDMTVQKVSKTTGFFSEFESPGIPTYTHDEKINGHRSLIAEFVECVRSGGVPETVCTDNIKSMAMVFGAVESAETGMPMKIII
jgi:predicted dehydrogenase